MDRTCYYRRPRLSIEQDKKACELLQARHSTNPYYGVRRLALILGWSHNKTRRIRNLSGVKAVVYRSSKTRMTGSVSQIAPPTNALKLFRQFRVQGRPQSGHSYVAMTNSGAWVQDFTHVRCGRQWYYLAVVVELSTRRVVGWSLGASHDTGLVLQALRQALKHNPAPPILHSDQGSEYLSYAHRDLCESYEIILSCSDAHSPWQNGFMESFFGKFKPELGDPSDYASPEILFETVAKKIHYYNNYRIHTALSMSPVDYAKTLKPKRPGSQKAREAVLREKVA